MPKLTANDALRSYVESAWVAASADQMVKLFGVRKYGG